MLHWALDRQKHTAAFTGKWNDVWQYASPHFMMPRRENRGSYIIYIVRVCCDLVNYKICIIRPCVVLDPQRFALVTQCNCLDPQCDQVSPCWYPKSLMVPMQSIMDPLRSITDSMQSITDQTQTQTRADGI